MEGVIVRNMKILKSITVLIFSFCLSSCGNIESEISKVTNVVNNSHETIHKEQKAENIALQFPEIKQAKAISSNGEMIVAFQVKQMQKFFTESIEKKVKEQLKKEFPEKEKIYVSHDLKIWLEVQKLETARQTKNLDSKELEKRFKKLNKLRKEKT